MKRIFDLCLVLVLLVVGAIPLAIVAIVVKLTSKGPSLYWSDRIGQGNRVFRMPKFRTMRVESPEVASHLLTDAQQWLTPVGSLLRRTSLDELPQLWSILVGDMTFVGPRPALHNQDDLIALRTFYGVQNLPPGLTGWAQINGRDESPIPDKVALDSYYLENQTLWLDFRIIVLTFLQVIRRKGTSVPAELHGVEQGDRIPAEAFFVSATAWFSQHQYDRAIADYGRFIDVVVDNAVAYNNRAAAWTAKGEYQKAIDDYSMAIQLSPGFSVAYHNRAFAWTETGQTDKARADFAKVSDLDPKPVAEREGTTSRSSYLPNDTESNEKITALIAQRDRDQIRWKQLAVSE